MKTLTTVCLLLFVLAASAQDLIIKNNGDTIDCRVTEVATLEVKYYYSYSPKLIFGIDKSIVNRIEFSTGEKITMAEDPFLNPEYYENQGKMALKVNFLSPLMGSTEFAFEKNIKPGRSWEAAIGIVGLGSDSQDLAARGAYGKFAFKLMQRPDFYLNQMRYAHILKGAYIAPEVAVRYITYDDWDHWDYDSNDLGRSSKFSVAFMLKFGKQWVFNDSFLIDLYGGIGYGIGGDDYETLNYGFIVAPDDFPVAVTGGIRIGYVFGKEKK